MPYSNRLKSLSPKNYLHQSNSFRTTENSNGRHESDKTALDYYNSGHLREDGVELLRRYPGRAVAIGFLLGAIVAFSLRKNG